MATTYMTVGEYAHRERSCERTVRNQIAKGQVPAKKSGRSWLIPAEWVARKEREELGDACPSDLQAVVANDK